MTLLKLLGGIAALVIALVFTFFLPGSGAEQIIVEVLGSLFGVLGLSSWRNNYGTVKTWYQSKTIVSAIFVAVGLIAIAAIGFFGLGVPEWVTTIITGIITVFGGGTLVGIFDAMKKSVNQNLKTIIFLIIAFGSMLYINKLFLELSPEGSVSLAAITALSGQTKAASQKTARQRSFAAKEDTGDTYVTVPPAVLAKVTCKINGVNNEGAFGENTIGQMISGELWLYAGEAAIRTFAHELVTKDIESVQLTTNGGKTFTFATADNTPALVFAYEEATLVAEKDDPDLIKLKFTGYRDNLVMS